MNWPHRNRCTYSVRQCESEKTVNFSAETILHSIETFQDFYCTRKLKLKKIMYLIWKTWSWCCCTKLTKRELKTRPLWTVHRTVKIIMPFLFSMKRKKTTLCLKRKIINLNLEEGLTFACQKHTAVPIGFVDLFRANIIAIYCSKAD